MSVSVSFSRSSSSPAKSSLTSKLIESEHGSNSSYSRMGCGHVIFTIVKYSTKIYFVVILVINKNFLLYKSL